MALPIIIVGCLFPKKVEDIQCKGLVSPIAKSEGESNFLSTQKLIDPWCNIMFKSFIQKPISSFRNAVFLAVILLLGTLAIQILAIDTNLKTVFSIILFSIEYLFIVAALFYAANKAKATSKRLSIAWGLMAYAQLSYAMGDAIWGYVASSSERVPLPLIAASFYLVYFVLFFVGIVSLPYKKLSQDEKLKTALDMGVIIIASGLGFWNFIIGPLVASRIQDSILSQFFSLAYPMGDILLTWALLMLLYRKGIQSDKNALYLLMASTSVMVITDCAFSYQTLQGTFEYGGIQNIGWSLSFLLCGLAGMMQAVSVQSYSQNQKTELTDRVSVKLERLMVYAPYVWVILGFLLMVSGYFSTLYVSRIPLSIGVGCVLVMVLLRQIIALRENNALNRQLNKALGKVKQQKLELEETNKELTDEISVRKRAEERLSYDALHDGLTGMPNRVLFLDRLGRAIEYTNRRPDYLFAVLFLDLDQFKVVNDSLGHAVGDKLLVSIAQRLKEKLRTSDTIARLGGDEFVCLLENMLKDDEAVLIADRILEELKQPFEIQNLEVHISASIGIVSNISGYHFPEEVLRDADIAMYRAKATGKSRYEIFNSNLRTLAIRRLELENELRHAVENDEFQLYYQPIVSLQTNDLTGFEALIRWRHPSRGLVMPNDFIPVAEESGLILPIGHWVLNEACRQMQEWRANYPAKSSLVVNVNISGKQFTQPNFIEQVGGALERSGLESSALKLEITETALIENSTKANEVFRKLGTMGVQLQIDDFGTGYSSLGYLQHFPIHTIKIDRTFVNEMKEGKKGADLIRAMVLMANDLGMDTIAEGVETEEQLWQLKTLDRKFVQGYLIARPMDSTKVLNILRNGPLLPVKVTGLVVQ